MSYKLKLDIFEGPLDLLLYLIRKNDIDICDIPITTITDQYMEYIEMMKMLDLEVVGEFLVMAATLIHIKSQMLLPQATEEAPEEEDPRDELVRRLQEYKMFKDAADELRSRELQRQEFFARQISEEAQSELKEDAKEVYFEANLFDLISAFTEAMNRVKESPVYEVAHEEFTVEQKIHQILHTLLDKPQVLLKDFFRHSRNRMEVIVTFMAVLELIRLKEIKVMQKRLFADIEVVHNRENVVPQSDTAPSV